MMEEGILVKNFSDSSYIKEEELLKIIHDFIEESVLQGIINEFVKEDVGYLRLKNRQIRWLAAKTRFRGSLE
jgi:hypothetical protein